MFVKLLHGVCWATGGLLDGVHMLGIPRMEKGKLIFEGLKSDEIELLEWYHHNLLSLYIETSCLT